MPGPDFAPLVRSVEREMVSALALSPLPIDPALSRAEGVWRDAPATIETRAYAGDALRYARFVTLVGNGLEIGNVLCLGAAETALPIFGADLVARLAPGENARWLTMLAADLSPTHSDVATSDRQLAGLGGRLAPLREALPPAGELPEWCARWFSPHAIFSRPRPDRLAAVGAALREMAAAFVLLAKDVSAEVARGGASPEMARHVVMVQDEYAAAHRADDRGLTLLARIFGTGWAGRYVERVLFPDSSIAGIARRRPPPTSPR